MSSRNKDERAHVNALVEAIQRNSLHTVYVYIDRDAGNVRHTSSGWDFQLSRGGKIVYCEAKEKNKKLSAWQEFTQAFIKAAGSPYLVVRFWDREFRSDGGFFTIDGGKTIDVEKAKIEDFL
jgi:hypothetical protein